MLRGAVIAALSAVLATLTVPLLPRTAAAQSAVIYPWCGEYGDSVEECAYTSFAQCRMSYRLCAPNAWYYDRDQSVYAGPSPYSYAPATDDPPSRRH
jgi:hypothetical protein